MKKHPDNNFTAINSNTGQLTEKRKNATGKKNIRYIYTEEDLGEGRLYAGIISSYPTVKKEKIYLQNNLYN